MFPFRTVYIILIKVENHIILTLLHHSCLHGTDHPITSNITKGHQITCELLLHPARLYHHLSHHLHCQEFIIQVSQALHTEKHSIPLPDHFDCWTVLLNNFSSHFSHHKDHLHNHLFLPQQLWTEIFIHDFPRLPTQPSGEQHSQPHFYRSMYRCNIMVFESMANKNILSRRRRLAATAIALFRCEPCRCGVHSQKQTHAHSETQYLGVTKGWQIRDSKGYLV